MDNPGISRVKQFLLIIILLFGWVLIVLYPNPVHLYTSISRLKNPPVIPLQVSGLALQFQDSTPSEIESFVYAQLPYSYDWEIYNMPWYFPSLQEAMQIGRGDCKARYLLFASLLEELNIPYQKNISLTHIWVDYEGKPQNTLENLEESMFITDESGRLRFSMPNPDLNRVSRSFYEGFWKVMPTTRKFLLFIGFPVIYGLLYLHREISNQGLIIFRTGLQEPGKQWARLGPPFV